MLCCSCLVHSVLLGLPASLPGAAGYLICDLGCVTPMMTGRQMHVVNHSFIHSVSQRQRGVQASTSVPSSR